MRVLTSSGERRAVGERSKSESSLERRVRSVELRIRDATSTKVNNTQQLALLRRIAVSRLPTHAEIDAENVSIWHPIPNGILPCILPPRRTPGRRGGGEGMRRRRAAPRSQNLKARPGPRRRGRIHQARPQHACGSTRITDRPELSRGCSVCVQDSAFFTRHSTPLGPTPLALPAEL